MIAPAPLPISVSAADLAGPIPEAVAEMIAALLLEAADEELSRECPAGDQEEGKPFDNFNPMQEERT